MAELFFAFKLRPCYVVTKNDEKKALFHGWSFISNIVEPSPMIGGHPGGVISYTKGIVELENGKVVYASPENIVFIDSPFDEYIWRKDD